MGQPEILQILKDNPNIWMSVRNITRILQERGMSFNAVTHKMRRLRESRMVDYDEVTTKRGNCSCFIYKHKTEHIANQKV